MIKQDEYIQFKAFARQYGALMGLLWVFSFACFVGSIHEPTLSFLFDFTIISIPFTAHLFTCRYRDQILSGRISFRRAFGFNMFVFFYAMLIMALAQWAYFEFLDNGTMIGKMIQTINTDEFKAILEQNQMSKKDIEQQFEVLAETRPIDFALTFMWLNSFAGLISSWLIALFVHRRRLKVNG